MTEFGLAGLLALRVGVAIGLAGAVALGEVLAVHPRPEVRRDANIEHRS